MTNEEWWEELVLRDPRFKARVAEARKNLRVGQGITLEQFQEKHGMGALKVAKPKSQRLTKKKPSRSQSSKKRVAKGA